MLGLHVVRKLERILLKALEGHMSRRLARFRCEHLVQLLAVVVKGLVRGGHTVLLGRGLRPLATLITVGSISLAMITDSGDIGCLIQQFKGINLNENTLQMAC